MRSVFEEEMEELARQDVINEGGSKKLRTATPSSSVDSRSINPARLCLRLRLLIAPPASAILATITLISLAATMPGLLHSLQCKNYYSNWFLPQASTPLPFLIAICSKKNLKNMHSIVDRDRCEYIWVMNHKKVSNY